MTMQHKILDAIPDGMDLTVEDITVLAWKKYPDTFGLHRFEENFPDSNKIKATLMGKAGLVGRNLIQRVGPNIYRKQI